MRRWLEMPRDEEESYLKLAKEGSSLGKEGDSIQRKYLFG